MQPFACVQISAGEQIDLMFGAKLGLSSMMAAGLGNTVADVVGINISHTIEVRAWRSRPPECAFAVLWCKDGGTRTAGEAAS